jgi:hypothetical protein
MRDPGDVERGTPVTITVLAQIKIMAGAMQPDLVGGAGIEPATSAL